MRTTETAAKPLALVYVRDNLVGQVLPLRGRFVFTPSWDAGPNVSARFVTSTPEEMRVQLAERGMRYESASFIGQLRELAWKPLHVEERKGISDPKDPLRTISDKAITLPTHKLTAEQNKSMDKHKASLTPKHIGIIKAYKDDSGQFNLPLRKKSVSTLNKEAAVKISRMRDITSHVQPDETYSYRGAYWSKPVPLGTEITDHGFTGTSLDPRTGMNFSHKRSLFAIHAPPGAKSYHLDRHTNRSQDENELAFHPDTHFRVIGHSKGALPTSPGELSSDPSIVTHLAVVGQGYKHDGTPDYSLTESPAGKLWMKHKIEAGEAGDWWRKMSLKARKAYLKEHPDSKLTAALRELAWAPRYVDIRQDATDQDPIALRSHKLPVHKLSPASEASMNRHQGKLSSADADAIVAYKERSSVVNKKMRGGKNARDGADLDSVITGMRHATSHVQPDETHSYRGVNIYKTLAPGTEITDHGFTGTSLKPSLASDFGRVFAIHAPPGAKSYYLDRHRNQNQHEKELNFHPDTHFRVIGSGGRGVVSGTGSVPVTHLAVVGQGYKHDGTPDYSLTESPAGKQWLSDKHAAGAENDWWRKMSPEARRLYKREHPGSKK